MSWDAIAWALGSPAKGTRKLVLIGLANYSRNRKCWPAIGTLASELGLSSRTVQQCIHELEMVGLIGVERRDHVSSIYEMLMSSSVAEFPPPAEIAPPPATSAPPPPKILHPPPADSAPPPANPAPKPESNHRDSRTQRVLPLLSVTSASPGGQAVDANIVAFPVEPAKPIERPDTAAMHAMEDQAVEAWNRLAHISNLSPVRGTLNGRRRSRLKARLAEWGLAGWLEALKHVEASDIWQGRTEIAWRPTIDALVSEEKFARVMEGGYANRPVKPAPAASQRATRRPMTNAEAHAIRMGFGEPEAESFDGVTLEAMP